MNRKEYNIAVKTYSHRLFAFIVKNCKNEEMANDLVQDTFEKLWVNKRDVKSEKARQWLFTTGYRLMINMIKREARVECNDNHIHEAWVDSSQASIENKDLIDHLLIYLSEQQKAIIMLRDYEGYDYKEIGNILSLSESQVKVYLFRARKKLKEYLKKNNYLVA